MTIKRRDFLKAALGGAALTAVGDAEALQREPKKVLPDAVGMLYDSTLCIGCKACMSACKEANHLPRQDLPGMSPDEPRLWDQSLDLSANTYNVIKAYINGDGAVKDREINGFAFVKRHCMHCVDPSCVSACPVSAMEKDPVSGVVRHHPERCIGCRYCVFSCPFEVPKYQYNEAFGEIKKCQMCSERLAVGKMPACCDVCPTGASLFGRVDDLKKEAERRRAAKPGDHYVFPRGNLSHNDRPPHEERIGHYQPEVYGERELGGTQVRYLAGVPFGKLGLPVNVPDYGYPTLSEGVQKTIYKGMIAPIVVLGGLVTLARRNTGGKDDE